MTNASVTIKIRQSSFEKLKQLAAREDWSQVAIMSRLIDEAYAAAFGLPTASPEQPEQPVDLLSWWTPDVPRNPRVTASVAAVRRALRARQGEVGPLVAAAVQVPVTVATRL